MNTQKRISCGRCQSKKIRCNKAQPRCDKCAAIGAECVYLPRKRRANKRSYLNDLSDKEILLDILGRLDRLEDHCKLNQNTDYHRDTGPSRAKSSSEDSDLSGHRSTSLAPLFDNTPYSPATPGEVTAHSVLGRIQDPRTSNQFFGNVFSHLRNVESRFYENEICVRAMEAAIKNMNDSVLENDTRTREMVNPPIIPKERLMIWMQNYYERYQYEGFRVPFDKRFLMSIPDLLGIPHVQLDYTCRIIYYNVLLHGMLLDPEYKTELGKIVPYIYRTCVELTECWLGQVKNTPADLLTAFLMTSMTLEGCNIELSWRILGHACAIARALGYFFVDGYPDEQIPMISSPSGHETEVDKNRKRFEFWHLLRVDCLFRLSFGKPAVIPAGSWKVNFPDPTINGVDDASTHFVQIHFLASMRLTLVMLKYLDLVDVPESKTLDDEVIDGFISEVQSIMSGWNAEELLTTTNNHVDLWFCVDILFSSYKMLIIFDQSKWNRSSDHLPYHTVDIARKSLKTFRSLIDSTVHAHWGTSLILLHQFIPLFILSLDIIGSPRHERGDLEVDLALVDWVSSFIERTAEERVELRPVMTVMRAMALTCRQVVEGGNY